MTYSPKTTINQSHPNVAGKTRGKVWPVAGQRARPRPSTALARAVRMAAWPPSSRPARVVQIRKRTGAVLVMPPATVMKTVLMNQTLATVIRLAVRTRPRCSTG